ncbi:MAG TPA: ATPase domain-containing protein, partial [Thermoplasmata archaeon]|nr:ATPase domain-containing protein [Thermoplasmata archaeon]
RVLLAMPAAKAPKPNPAPAAAAPPARPGPKPYASALTPKDIDHAQKDALLQLSIGRGAHYYSVGVAAALLLDTALVLLFPPTLSGSSSGSLSSLYFLALPLVGGAYIAVYGLWVKWEEYQVWPWEAHFAMSFAAVPLDAALLVLWGSKVFNYGPAASWTLLPAFYPLSLLSLSLPMVGLALTWPEWTQSKTLGVAASIGPLFLAAVVFVPGLTVTAHASAIALSLAVSAVLYLMSGSFLHLIASGTRPHERAVILSAQSRLNLVAKQLKDREEAVRFREASLIGREADAENAEIGIQRKLETIEESRSHVTTLESEAQARSGALARVQRELAIKLAETNARAKGLEDRDQALQLREKDLAARLPRVSNREKETIRREGEIVQREAATNLRIKELERRAAESTELEARLTARRQEIDRKTQELLAKESEIARTAATPPKAGAAPDPEATAKEARLAALQQAFEQQKAALERRAAELQAQQADVSKSREALTREIEDLRIQEAQAAEREKDAAERTSLADETVRRYEEEVKRLDKKILEVDGRAANLVEKGEELAQRERDFEARAKAQATRETEFGNRRTEVDRREREVSLQSKRLTALEDELRLAKQSVAKRTGRTEDFSIAFMAAAEPAYLKPEAKGPPRSVSMVDSSYVPPTGPEEPGMLSRPVTTRFPDRLPTGTPRLDDLLLGGIPPKGHIMLIGDAFVGKEVALYAFLTEGLKRGEGAIIVSAARAPEEVEQKIGLVAPQFHEYEQLDMVRWIDASSAEGIPVEPNLTRTHQRVGGPHDRKGILQALVQASNSLGNEPKRPIRVAFLGLSACLGNADDRERLQFVQNFVGALKTRSAIALYSLETGTLPETQLETVLARLDGAIYFKREGGRTFLSVQGVGEVESRDWIEYRATNRALVIGSFALERIR